MKDIFKRFNKHIAILLGVTLIVPLLIFSTQGIAAKAVAKEKSEDARIASEVSNMTGIQIAEIMKLREQNKSWNEILEMLKINKDLVDYDARNIRNELLIKTGFDKDLINELLKVFSNEDVMEAKFLVERLIFQLTEITEYTEIEVNNPSAEVYSPKEDDIHIYKKLLDEINLDTAVYLILELKEDFGTLEDVLNEYLLSLQLEIKLENYLEDKDKYLSDKAEKTITMIGEPITLAKIEEKMLEEIQKQNSANINQSNDLTEVVDQESKEIDIYNTIDSPIPTINEVKPKNPADAIAEELKIINPNN